MLRIESLPLTQGWSELFVFEDGYGAGFLFLGNCRSTGDSEVPFFDSLQLKVGNSSLPRVD